MSIIVSTGAMILYGPETMIMDTFYTVYDILLDGQLFKMVPEEFMESYGKYEENTE